MATEQKIVYGMAAEFSSAAALYHAAERVRDAGFKNWDVHSPYPIHGMDKAMGMRKSWLSAFIFCCGLTGFITGLLLVTVTSYVLYATIVNGKPNDWSHGMGALQFFFPVMYELTILFSAFGAVFGMIIRNGLRFKERWRSMFETEGGPPDAETKWRNVPKRRLDEVCELEVTEDR